MSNFDRRRAPWLIDGDRDKTFKRMRELALEGYSSPQIAVCLGTSFNALSCYMNRQGITMKELREQDRGEK